MQRRSRALAAPDGRLKYHSKGEKCLLLTWFAGDGWFYHVGVLCMRYQGSCACLDGSGAC